MEPPHGRKIGFQNADAAAFAAALLNSSLFYWWYSVFSHCEHVNDALVRSFPVPKNWSTIGWVKLSDHLVDALESDATKKTINTKQGHVIEYDEISAAKSKELIDRIDEQLMNIAVLSWGSLIWNRRGLAITEKFKPIGPSLQIEFCCISGDGRLTLVIDETFGVSCSTYATVSVFGGLDSALGHLWVREGALNEALPKNVRTHGRGGFVEVASGDCCAKANERHPKAMAMIRTCAQENGFDAAIWTALDSNFHKPDKAGEPFSVEAAIRYLSSLEKPGFAKALHYMWNAPREIETPVRAAANACWPVG